MTDQQCEAQRHDGTRCPRRASRHLPAAVQERPRKSPAPDPRTVHLCGQHRNSLESGVMAVTLHDDEGGRATVYQDREGSVFWDVYRDRVSGGTDNHASLAGSGVGEAAGPGDSSS